MNELFSRFQNSDFGNASAHFEGRAVLWRGPNCNALLFVSVGLLFVSVGALFVPAVGFTPPTYPVSVALFGVLCFSRFPRCCQSSSKRCVRQLLLRQSSLNRCSRQVLLRPVGIRPLISPLVTGSGIASVTGGRIWSSRGRVSGGPRTNTARPWLCHRRRDHC